MTKIKRLIVFLTLVILTLAPTTAYACSCSICGSYVDYYKNNKPVYWSQSHAGCCSSNSIPCAPRCNGHSPEKVYSYTVAPTCTMKGYDWYVCKLCGEEGEERNIKNAVGHNWVWRYDSTEHWQYCGNSCHEGHRYQNEGAHSFARTVSGNTVTYTCSTCGYSYSETTHTHDYEPKISLTYSPLNASSHTVYVTSVGTCKGCGDVKTSTSSHTESHSFGSWSGSGNTETRS